MSSDSLLIGNLEVRAIALGPAVTNAYLVGDPDTELAVVIDPAWDGDRINREAELRGWRIHQIWLTHAHFDHFGGARAISEASATPIPVALHADDHSLWRMGGGAFAFGISDFDPGPEPTVNLEHGMMLRLGAHEFEVRLTAESRGRLIPVVKPTDHPRVHLVWLYTAQLKPGGEKPRSSNEAPSAEASRHLARRNSGAGVARDGDPLV